ncbi:CAMK family protein kinase [Tritrichomonas foetus]|uniref:CAMK family protein kinase n=1 Tax=Tritrichomonas foetus TaxID=1144522 RepID=A0A1J4JMX9_9EUKA|nr:CAMK family protein kinase [Tritrichomonas foetus]|eukprot:OHS98604.1 CAMK family protein kinase [Tritrichomonas foetus]
MEPPQPDVNFPHHFGRYTYKNVIGRGAYGIVVDAIGPNKEEFAVKIISRNFLQETNTFFAFEQELRVHQHLGHSNIVGIKEIIYEEDFIFIVMELCSKGDLFTFISEEGPLNITTVRHIFFQILLSVQYLHKREIAHLDLKPDNILITKDGQAKLSDFGCCEAPPKRQTFGAIGTLYYAAPEILTRKYTENLPADIWSLGIILFAMTAGSLPWLPGTDEEICDQILKGNLTMPHDLPSNVYKIMYKCCQVDRDARPTIDELIGDPWFDIERQKIDQVQHKVKIMNSSASLKTLRFQTKKKIEVRPNSSVTEINTRGVTTYKSLPRIAMSGSHSNFVRSNRSRSILFETH